MGEDATDDHNSTLLRGCFMSIAALFKSISYAASVLEIGIALQAEEFCKWGVLQAAQHAGFGLEWCSDFDCSHFPGYKPVYSSGTGRKFQNARFYVFQLKKNHGAHSGVRRELLRFGGMSLN
jgi:hypothetical protein